MAVIDLNAKPATLRSIVQRPLAFTLMDDGKRRALMRRFPYYIYLLLMEVQVVVTAIVHQRRAIKGYKELHQLRGAMTDKEFLKQAKKYAAPFCINKRR